MPILPLTCAVLALLPLQVKGSGFVVVGLQPLLLLLRRCHIPHMRRMMPVLSHTKGVLPHLGARFLEAAIV